MYVVELCMLSTRECSGRSIQQGSVASAAVRLLFDHDAVLPGLRGEWAGECRPGTDYESV